MAKDTVMRQPVPEGMNGFIVVETGVRLDLVMPVHDSLDRTKPLNPHPKLEEDPLDLPMGLMRVRALMCLIPWYSRNFSKVRSAHCGSLDETNCDPLSVRISAPHTFRIPPREPGWNIRSWVCLRFVIQGIALPWCRRIR